MDWKHLAQFALLGSSDLEQYAILLVRVSLGLFFAISGANKLFVAGGTKPVYETLVQAKIPFPHFTAYFVSGVEFVAGSLVTVGFLSSPASAALLIDMIVATGGRPGAGSLGKMVVCRRLPVCIMTSP